MKVSISQVTINDISMDESTYFIIVIIIVFVIIIVIIIIIIIIIIVIIIITTSGEFLMVLNWSLSKSLQVSKTLLSILADLNNAVVWMFITCPLISKSFCPIINPSATVARAPITIGINVTFMFHGFFNSLGRSRYLSFFSLSFNFTQWSAGTAKSTILQVLFFCFWLL